MLSGKLVFFGAINGENGRDLCRFSCVITSNNNNNKEKMVAKAIIGVYLYIVRGTL